MSLEGWKDLKCECGGMFFQASHKISWHEGQGLVRKADGEVCCECGKRVNTEKMIKVEKTKSLKKKIEELEANV